MKGAAGVRPEDGCRGGRNLSVLC